MMARYSLSGILISGYATCTSLSADGSTSTKRDTEYGLVVSLSTPRRNPQFVTIIFFLKKKTNAFPDNHLCSFWRRSAEASNVARMSIGSQSTQQQRAERRKKEVTKEKFHLKGCPQRLGDETLFFVPRGKSIKLSSTADRTTAGGDGELSCESCQWPMNEAGERIDEASTTTSRVSRGDTHEAEKDTEEEENKREEGEAWRRRRKMGGSQKKKWRKNVKRKRNVVWIPVKMERESPKEDEEEEEEEGQWKEEHCASSTLGTRQQGGEEVAEATVTGGSASNEATSGDDEWKSRRSVCLNRPHLARQARNRTPYPRDAIRDNQNDEERHKKYSSSSSSSSCPSVPPTRSPSPDALEDSRMVSSPTVPQHSATSTAEESLRQGKDTVDEDSCPFLVSSPSASSREQPQQHQPQGREINKLREVFQAGFIPEAEFLARLALLCVPS